MLHLGLIVIPKQTCTLLDSHSPLKSLYLSLSLCYNILMLQYFSTINLRHKAPSPSKSCAGVSEIAENNQLHNTKQLLKLLEPFPSRLIQICLMNFQPGNARCTADALSPRLKAALRDLSEIRGRRVRPDLCNYRQGETRKTKTVEPTWPHLYITEPVPVAIVQCGAVVWPDVNRALVPLEAQPCALMQQLWAHALLS